MQTYLQSARQTSTPLSDQDVVFSMFVTRTAFPLVVASRNCILKHCGQYTSYMVNMKS